MFIFYVKKNIIYNLYLEKSNGYFAKAIFDENNKFVFYNRTIHRKFGYKKK